MFSSHQEPFAAETASPVTSARPAQLWAVRSAAIALAIGVAAGSVLVGSHVAFAQTPIGGSAGLFALYAATVAVGVGLAVLFQLVAFASRLAATLTPPPAKVISLLPPSRAPEASEADWQSRPFNAA